MQQVMPFNACSVRLGEDSRLATNPSRRHLMQGIVRKNHTCQSLPLDKGVFPSIENSTLSALSIGHAKSSISL